MTQLTHQQSQQGIWTVVGPPTSCALQLAQPLVVTYADGSTDTLAAHTPAVAAGGTTQVDRTAKVWIGYVSKGDPTLRLVPEALLAALVGEYAPLARVLVDRVLPYQPQASAAGASVWTYALVSDLSARVLDLSPSTAPPADWEQPAFDDSAWASAVAAYHANQTLDFDGATLGSDGPGGAVPIWATVGPTTTQQSVLLRQAFSLPAVAISSAQLVVEFDCAGTVYLNGALLGSDTSDPTTGPTLVFDVTSVLLPGAANLLACWGTESGAHSHNTWVVYALRLQTPGGGAVPEPVGSTQGDLLSYQGGAWARLGVGSSGQALLSTTTDPSWGDAAAAGPTRWEPICSVDGTVLVAADGAPIMALEPSP